MGREAAGVRILIETSGGGGIVLVVVAALLAGHSGPVSAALAAVLIALAVVVALAVGGLVALLVYRARQVRPHFTYRAEVAPASKLATRVANLPAQTTRAAGDFEPPALEAPAVRLHPEQLEQLAEILRRRERPE
jgi:hypothetical protein